MTKLRISSDLSLPADETVTQTFGILAKRGAGKTYAAAVMVEELLKAGHQVVVVDPLGVWWGLRASAGGKGEGFPIVVLGGDHADVPLEEGGGEVVADLAVDGVSLILDLSHMRKNQARRFMLAFAERLYHRKSRSAAPLHLVLDEADLFVPQGGKGGPKGDLAQLVGAMEDLVRRGRAKGIGVTLITQRSAVIAKDVLTQIDTLVVLRTTGPQDRKAIEAWVNVHGDDEGWRKMIGSLHELPIGTAWVWSPGWLGVLKRARIRERETFDSSATPKAGTRARQPKHLADVDLEALKDRMASTIERAKAEDPKELRKQLAEAQRQLRARPQETRAERVEKVVEIPVFKDGQLKQLGEAIDKLGVFGEELRVAVQEATMVWQDVGAATQLLSSALDAARKPHRATPEARTRPSAPQRPAQRQERASPRPAAVPSDSSEVQLRAGERRMLQALARHYPMKVTKAQLGTLSAFAPRGGTFRTYFNTLKRHGLISEQGNEIEISQAGLDYLGADVPPAPTTTEEMLDMWRGALRAGERQMLDVLVDHYPNGLSREDLGALSGFEPSGGTFRTYLNTLRRNGLAEVDGDEIRASETLFLSGVPA